MARKRFDAESYLRKYAAGFPRLETVAKRLQSFTVSVFADSHLPIHLIATRPKSVESAREKIQRKGYRRPARQLTDKIGLRVITYYRDDVDKAVEVLGTSFEVHPQLSVDKRTALGLTSFGYRSVHLIARPKPKKLLLEYAEIRNVWCEIQVRSLLEHAWAEIEHEVVYKSGISYPKDFSRQFAALAGALEILDSEFLALREQRSSLIETHKAAYQQGQEGRKRLDSARLIGLLECDYPLGLGWRAAEQRDEPFRAHSDARSVSALQAAGIITADSLRQVLRSRLHRRLTLAFANYNQIPREEISHFAIVLMALAAQDPRLIESYFPDVALDPAIANVLAIARHAN